MGGFSNDQNILTFLRTFGWIMERTGDEPDSLDQLKNTLQAAIKEVQVDVGAFKEQMVQKMEALSDSSRPLAGAVSRLQEENLQLRAKLEVLSCLVEGLTGVKVDRGAGGENVRKVENGQMQSQEVARCPAGTGPGTSPAPPPWRTRRQAEVNVSTLFSKEAKTEQALVVMETV